MTRIYEFVIFGQESVSVTREEKIVPDRTNELKARIEAKKKELEQNVAQLKADAHGAKNDQIEEMEARLKELNQLIKDGWDNISEAAVVKLNAWLK